MKISKMQRAAFPEVVYSQCWEDPDTVRKALRIAPDDDVLMITSAGCNMLALLLNQPRSITAIDINPSQNYLLELKMQAVVTLSHEELLTFVGAQPPVRERRPLYYQVRQSLPDAARSYWDAHQDDIERGIIHIGRFERYLTLFRRLVLPLVHSRERVEGLLQPKSLDEQKLFYDREWDTFRWRTLFRVSFQRGLLSRFGRFRGAFQFVDSSDVPARYIERARHAMREIPISNNYFLQYMATGGYQTALPPYLSSCSQEVLRCHASRVSTVTADLRSFLKTVPPDSYSKFYLSDVLEYFSTEDYEVVLSEIVRAAKPGARLCYYNNLIERSYPESLCSMFQSETDLSRRLHWRDRSFLYRSVVIEQVNK